MNHGDPPVLLREDLRDLPPTLHRAPCVLVVSEAIRHSTSLSNSPGIYHMSPSRFPFQMAIDFIFKSVFNDHSNPGFDCCTPVSMEVEGVKNGKTNTVL